jgi:hypothetical protein
MATTAIAGGWLVVGGWLPNLQIILRATRLHPSSQILRLKFKHKTKNCLNKIINKSIKEHLINIVSPSYSTLNTEEGMLFSSIGAL